MSGEFQSGFYLGFIRESDDYDQGGGGSLGVAQTGDDAFRRLGFEFAGTKGGGGIFGFGGRFRAPSFDAAFAQQVFQNFPLVRGQVFGVSHNSVQGESIHRFRLVSLWIVRFRVK